LVTAVIYRGRLERRLSVMAFMMRLSFRKATPDPYRPVASDR
jgi:hypothetical protein